MQNSPEFSSSGKDNTGSDSIGHLADVKVEEVDLDSVTDDDDEMIGRTRSFQFKGVKNMVTVREESKGLPLADDSSNQPSLTLQSFARIPALATQDIIPFIHNATHDLAVCIRDERQLPHDLTGEYSALKTSIGIED